MYYYGGELVMGEIKRQKIGKLEYVYFQYYDRKERKTIRIYCGRADNPRALAKAIDLKKIYLEKKLQEIEQYKAKLSYTINAIKHELTMLSIEARSIANS